MHDGGPEILNESFLGPQALMDRRMSEQLEVLACGTTANLDCADD
jgi:hypothetical protein